MSAAFPPMPSRSLPVRPVKSEQVGRARSTRIRDAASVRRLDCPAAAGPRASIGGKAEEMPRASKDIKHRPAGSLGRDCRQTEPRREHGRSILRSCPSTPANTLRRVDSTRPRGPQDESLISRRRRRGLAAINLRWGIQHSRSPQYRGEGTTKVCVGCSRRPARPAQKNASVSP
jgi:hypothetical protein